MASNINPSLTPTNSLANFRFWCQKVLPLVYDDSLSYYEVLGKMVVQLNDVIDNVNADTENVLTLKDAFLELQTYVNNFFDDIDQLASYAERAETAQTAANQSAINAATSASNASESSLAAMNARDAAVTARQVAETSANTASTAADNANTKANEAAQSAITAQTAQASASQSATLAATDRSAAQTAASTATTKANEASTSATNAETSAENAAQSESNAEELVNNIQENLDNIQQNTEDINTLTESISDITEPYINIVDDTDLLEASGWTENNGEYTGTLRSINTAFANGFPTQENFETETQYTASLYAYTDGNQLSTATNGLRIRITYTDDSFDQVNWLNNVSSYERQSITSAVGKTIKAVSLLAVNGLDNIWHIKEFQIEKGTDATDYVPFQLTAIDKVARSTEKEIPSYYFENNYIETKADSIINNTMSSTQTFNVGFITDVHVRNNAGQSTKLFAYLAKKVNSLKYLLFGGDVCVSAGSSVDDLKAQGDEWLNMIDDYNRNYVFSAMGNHDYNGNSSSGSYVLTNSQCMYYADNNLEYIVNKPFGKFYYYLDFINNNLRIIVVDDYDKNSANGRGGSYGISQEQYDWIINTALNCSWKNIVFLTHQTADEAMQNYNANYAPLQAIFKAVKNKTNLIVHSAIAWLEKDFTADTNVFVCTLCGHSHLDESHVDDNVLTICTNCDSLYNNVSGYNRTRGTITEQSFDVCVFDFENKTIKLTRIGAGTDRSFDY